MARQWTESQKQAIDSRNGTVLVSAAAGSGKTAKIMNEINEYVKNTNQIN